MPMGVDPTPSLCPMQLFALHALNADEDATIQALRPHACNVRVLPTHCINVHAELEGFAVRFPDHMPGSVLPVNRAMFTGHTLFECTGEPLVNRDVVRLLSQTDNADRLLRLVQTIDARSKGQEASFDCSPDNADSLAGMREDGTPIVSRTLGKRAVDSRHWLPEAPQITGLYHAMVRGFQKDVRQHKLFVGVSGGCSKACDSFYNLMMDVGHEWTCREVAESEECWWLRKACLRSRCAVAKQVADAFGLQIRTQRDVNSYEFDERVGIPTVDTVEFDLSHDPETRTVTLFNAAVDTTAVQNGILCHMNPSEGFWLFKGSPRASARSTSFGSMFGCERRCGVFPTRSPCYPDGQGHPSCLHALDTAIVSRLYTPRRAAPAKTSVYQCFDEIFMRNLETMLWNRDHGVVELLPIAVCAF